MVRDIPLSVYREWPQPNYVNPATRGNGLLIVNIVFITLVTLSIIVRAYSRTKQSRPGVDDVMIFIAYIFTLALTAVVLLANKSYGWDRHVWDVPPSAIEPAAILAFCAKLTFVCAKLTFVCASSFTRFSLIFLYYRLIKESTTKWYRWSIHFGLAFNVAVFVVLIFIGIFGCMPVEKYWKFPEVVDGTCLDEGVITMVAGVMSCVADLLCTIIPIPIIMRLHMPLRDRIGVVVLLSAGIIVTIAGVLRTVFIWQALVGTYDESWHTYPLWICAAVEIDLAVICACVPAMKTVLWKPFQRWTGEIYSQFSSKNESRLEKSKNRDRHTKPELTSQDPIVEGENDSDESENGYRLNSLEFGKGSPLEQPEERLPGRTEKLALFPSANQHRSESHSKKASQTVTDISNFSRLEINKQTTFQVSNLSNENLSKDQRDKIKKRSLIGMPSGPNAPSNLAFPEGQPYNATPKLDWD